MENFLTSTSFHNQPINIHKNMYPLVVNMLTYFSEFKCKHLSTITKQHPFPLIAMYLYSFNVGNRMNFLLHKIYSIESYLKSSETENSRRLHFALFVWRKTSFINSDLWKVLIEIGNKIWSY